jgi:hypothetical protein
MRPSKASGALLNPHPWRVVGGPDEEAITRIVDANGEAISGDQAFIVAACNVYYKMQERKSIWDSYYPCRWFAQRKEE